jgi:CheY-like chemotaxis protein
LVGNGEQAVETALAAMHAGTPFDAILMDMQMPVLDGCEAVRALRLEGYEGRIIALTVRSMDGERQEVLDAGCNDVLLKPIDPDRVVAMVAESASTVRAEI